jgi:hypothetical protein
MDIKIAHVKDSYTLALNKGSLDGIKIGQRFLVYSIGEEIYDPDTKISLGKLEIVKGTGKVTHLQDHIATISSDMKESPTRVIRKPKIGSYYQSALAYALANYGTTTEVEEILPADRVPFVDPTIGDISKPI